MQLPRPDLTVFLYMPTNVSLELKRRMSEKSGEKPDGHENNIPHLRRSESAYLELSDLYKWIKIECAPDGTMSSLKTPEKIHEEMWTRLRPYLF